MIRVPKYLATAALLLVSLLCMAQEKGGKKEKKHAREKKEKKVPENIEVYSHDFMFRPRFVIPTVWFNVSSRLTGKGASFTWKPAMPGIAGAAIKIKKVYISAGVKLPVTDAFKKQYGDSKSRDIFVNIQGRVVGWTLFYRDYKGFYLSDYQKNYPNWNRDSLGYPKSNNLRVIEGGVNLGFIFNKDFSMNAAFAQTERQKKGAGSFLMTVSERYQHIETDSNIVPVPQAAYYPSLNRLVQGNFFSTIISFGAGYQFIINRFHFTPVVLAGTGVQVQSYTQRIDDATRSKLRFNIPTYASAKAQLGYNGEHFFTNIIYQLEFNSIPIRESRIRLVHNMIEFGVGMRF